MGEVDNALPAIQIRELRKVYGNKAAVDGLNLEVPRGCFFGFLAAYNTGSIVAGMLAGIAAGLLLGLLFGFLTISLGVDQVIVGIAITILGGGLTAFLFRDIFGRQNPSADVTPLMISVPPTLIRAPVALER